MFVFYVCMTAGKCYFHSLVCEVFFLLFSFSYLPAFNLKSEHIKFILHL